MRRSNGVSGYLWKSSIPRPGIRSHGILRTATHLSSCAYKDDALQLSFATGIALDREGSIYVSGYEIANDNDVTSNAGDATYLVFKLDSSANLLWHTYVLWRERR